MTQEKNLEGREVLVGRDATREQAIEWAFDYRGYVTIVKRDGSEVVAYVFNRTIEAPQPYLQYFDEQGEGPHAILIADVQSIRFTGQDMAAGKSWEAWQRRKQHERLAGASTRPSFQEPMQ